MYYTLTSNGAIAKQSLIPGKIIGKAYKKIANTGYVDKDYEKTAFGSFLKNTVKPNCLLTLSKKDKCLYIRPLKKIGKGEALSVDLRSLKLLGKLYKDRKTDYTGKIRPEFSDNRDIEVFANYLPGTDFGRSYNA